MFASLRYLLSAILFFSSFRREIQSCEYPKIELSSRIQIVFQDIEVKQLQLRQISPKFNTTVVHSAVS